MQVPKIMAEFNPNIGMGLANVVKQEWSMRLEFLSRDENGVFRLPIGYCGDFMGRVQVSTVNLTLYRAMVKSGEIKM